MSLINSIIEIFWLFLPGYAANMAPVIAARYHWLPRLSVPLDGGRAYRGSRLLGDNKTVRGIVVGLAAGVATGGLQFPFAGYGVIEKIALFTSQNAMGYLLISALLAAGALLGDVAKSFIKRRLNISAGAAWIPWDQIDSTLGMIAIAIWFVPLTLIHITSIIIISAFITYIISCIGVALRIKKNI